MESLSSTAYPLIQPPHAACPDNSSSSSNSRLAQAGIQHHFLPPPSDYRVAAFVGSKLKRFVVCCTWSRGLSPFLLAFSLLFRVCFFSAGDLVWLRSVGLSPDSEWLRSVGLSPDSEWLRSVGLSIRRGYVQWDCRRIRSGYVQWDCRRIRRGYVQCDCRFGVATFGVTVDLVWLRSV